MADATPVAVGTLGGTLGMSEAQAQRVITAALAVGAIIITVDDWPKVHPRRYIGLLVASLFLAIGSEIAPGVAGPLAVLVVVSMLLARGDRVLLRIARLVGA